ASRRGVARPTRPVAAVCSGSRRSPSSRPHPVWVMTPAVPVRSVEAGRRRAAAPRRMRLAGGGDRADTTMDTGGATRGGAVGAGSTTFATTEPTGWVGWNVFAATILMIAGALHLIWGFVAVVNDDWVVWGNRADLYIDLSAWGWVHLAAGAVVLLAGFGVLTGNVLARIVGVAVAGVSFI